MRPRPIPYLLVLAMTSGVFANPCIDRYPAAASEILTGPAGTVSRVEPVEWFEDGVFRITTDSGGVIMLRPGELPLPPVGAALELRVYSVSATALPIAGCYCQSGTDLCIEEYSYP